MRKFNPYYCTNCSREYIRLENPCRQCDTYNTIVEKQSDAMAKSAASSARRLRRRAKDSERNSVRDVVAVDGFDERYRGIASTTGRTGHITNFRVDGISNTYAIENKNRKLASWAVTAWGLVQQRAYDLNKEALMVIDLPNQPRNMAVNGIKITLSKMHIITQARHEQLLRSQKTVDFLLASLSNIPELSETINEAHNILQGRNKT